MLDVAGGIGYLAKPQGRHGPRATDAHVLSCPTIPDTRRAARLPVDPVLTTPRRCLRFASLLAVLAVAACSTLPPAPSPPPGGNAQASTTVANNVLFRAIGLVGTPYHWGGNTPESGFDCSGLVDYVYRTAAGINLPRTSREMAALSAPKVARDDLEAGDLLFFGRRHHVNHVAIYVGHGRFVNAPDRGGTVRLDHLDGDYWRDHFLFARRVLAPAARATLSAD